MIWVWLAGTAVQCAYTGPRVDEDGYVLNPSFCSRLARPTLRYPRTVHALDKPPERKPDPKTLYEPRCRLREPYYYGGGTHHVDPTVYRQNADHNCVYRHTPWLTTGDLEYFMDDALYWGER
jgi:hypothetical protein